MAQYKLTQEAEEDLREIAIYTLERWGLEFLTQYQAGILEQFEKLTESSIFSRSFSKQYPDLLVAKYRFHYIFYFSKVAQPIEIIGVIHEQRNIVKQLSDRFS